MVISFFGRLRVASSADLEGMVICYGRVVELSGCELTWSCIDGDWRWLWRHHVLEFVDAVRWRNRPRDAIRVRRQSHRRQATVVLPHPHPHPMVGDVSHSREMSSPVCITYKSKPQNRQLSSIAAWSPRHFTWILISRHLTPGHTLMLYCVCSK